MHFSVDLTLTKYSSFDINKTLTNKCLKKQLNNLNTSEHNRAFSQHKQTQLANGTEWQEPEMESNGKVNGSGTTTRDVLTEVQNSSTNKERQAVVSKWSYRHVVELRRRVWSLSYRGNRSRMVEEPPRWTPRRRSR